VPKVGIVSLSEKRPFVGYAPACIGADSEAVELVFPAAQSLHTKRKGVYRITFVKETAAVLATVRLFLKCRCVCKNRSERFLGPNKSFHLQGKIINAVAI